MNGDQAFIHEYERKIEVVLKSHPELKGFRNYLTDIAISSTYQYIYYISCFLEFVNKPPNLLTFDDFTGYLYYIQLNQYGERTVSSYRIVVYSALKKYNAYLVSANILSVNYMLNIKRPKSTEIQKTIDKRAEGFLSKDEIQKYISNVKSCNTTLKVKKNISDPYKTRDIAIIMIFLNTGIRCSALIKLDVNNIDIENSEIVVTDKGGKINKHMISDDTKQCLIKWLSYREELLKNNILQKNEDALFISSHKRRMSPQAVYDIVKKYTVGINGKNISPHKLRATYGTQLYNETKDLFFVQEMMGHSNPKTTTLYIRDKSNMKEKASTIMANLTKLD